MSGELLMASCCCEEEYDLTFDAPTIEGPVGETGGYGQVPGGDPAVEGTYDDAWEMVDPEDYVDPYYANAGDEEPLGINWGDNLAGPVDFYYVNFFAAQIIYDLSSLATVTAARLRIAASAGGNNNWEGNVELAVRVVAGRFNDSGPPIVPARLQDLLAVGAAVGSFQTAVNGAEFGLVLDAGALAQLDVDGEATFLVYPTKTLKLAYPGSAGYYHRHIVLASELDVAGTLD